MKNIIISLITLGLCVHAQAQDRTLSTADGATYNGITFQRVEPDGLYIEYTFPKGGLGVSKIKFSRLSRAQQKSFGFNEDKALDYEAAVALANENVAHELTRRYEAERDALRQREADNQSAYPARMAEIARINAAQAASFAQYTASDSKANSSISYSTDFTAGHSSSQTIYSPVLGEDPFPNRNITTRSH